MLKSTLGSSQNDGKFNEGEEMKKKVEILCVLDRSGSMSSIMEEAVSAFNGFVEQQKTLPAKANLTLVAFDHEYTVVYDKVKLAEVQPLKVSDVPPRGMTALNDAIGRAMANVTSKNVVMLIQTDGHENASKEYTSEAVKKLIEEKKAIGWDISFIGAGIDAFASGSAYGILRDKCLSVGKNEKG
ncbi:MAG TPA: hypothetical protein DCS09_03870, partial [Porphyromonadaceae bacterium]|nr:hypothetical protein [Porphyromonadaceae bacterium]